LTLVELLKKRLADELDSKKEAVSSGFASDYADYRYRIGLIEGLKIAENELSEILANYEES
tara:strand:+ start:239 stop:421 length:183 start_codon:yes stop_codon:yes gene_type:complete